MTQRTRLDRIDRTLRTQGEPVCRCGELNGRMAFDWDKAIGTLAAGYDRAADLDLTADGKCRRCGRAPAPHIGLDWNAAIGAYGGG